MGLYDEMKQLLDDFDEVKIDTWNGCLLFLQENLDKFNDSYMGNTFPKEQFTTWLEQLKITS